MAEAGRLWHQVGGPLPCQDMRCAQIPLFVLARVFLEHRCIGEMLSRILGCRRVPDTISSDGVVEVALDLELAFLGIRGDVFGIFFSASGVRIPNPKKERERRDNLRDKGRPA